MPASASIAWPGASPLVRDYLEHFERVARFYPGGAPFDWAHLAQQAAARPYPADRRRAMAELLARQNQAWGPGGAIPPPTAALIERFAAAGTVAVVTGQQVGVFGGPLLVLYKAMTAIQVAERLCAQGVNAVPVFWMATQDADRAEVDHVNILGPEAQVQRATVALEGPIGAPCGDLTLGAGVEAALAQVVANGDGAAPAEAYRPGVRLGEAFAQLLARWFAPWGLILFDPLRAAAAGEFWQPLYLAAFDRQAELAAQLAGRARDLEAAGYHAQVEQTAAAGMLFFHRDGARLGLRHKGQNCLLGEREISRAEARAFIAAHPGQVSPAALLRPLLQDTAFPTVAQVTGPAETAYLAQSAVLYAALQVPPPVAWPRASATLVDARAQRLLTQYGLRPEQVWGEAADLLLARRALPAGIERSVAAMRAGFEREFDQLARALEALDPTLVDASRGARQKILHQLEQLDARVARSFARRHGEIQAQARHLEGLLHPGRQLQERELAAAAFLARNPALLSQLHASLSPGAGRHQFLPA